MVICSSSNRKQRCSPQPSWVHAAGSREAWGQPWAEEGPAARFKGSTRGFVPCSVTLWCSGQLLNKTLGRQEAQSIYKLQTIWRSRGSLSCFPPYPRGPEHLKMGQLVLLRTLRKEKDMTGASQLEWGTPPPHPDL